MLNLPVQSESPLGGGGEVVDVWLQALHELQRAHAWRTLVGGEKHHQPLTRLLRGRSDMDHNLGFRV